MEQTMEFALSLSTLDAATATQQQIADRLDGLIGEGVVAQRLLYRAIEQHHAAERLALQTRCGELGHVLKVHRGLFGPDDVRCCAICGAAAPKAG